MRSGYLRALGTIAMIVAPLTAGVFTIATELVAAVFGPKWTGMTTSLRILCLGGACMALFSLLGAIVAGSGRPELGARGTYVFLIFVAVPIYPALRFGGQPGAAICVSVAALAAVLYLGKQAGRLTESSPSEVARVMAGPIAAALVMSGCLAGFHLLVNPAPSLALVGGEVAAGAAIYVLTALQLDRVLGAGLLDSLRSAWRAA
jgi:O-antigen/teichoic acid export membrane protein